MAGGLYLPTLRRPGRLAGNQGACGVSWLSPPGIRDSRYDLPGYAQASTALVSRHLAGDQPEEWCQCRQYSVSSGPGKLLDRLDLAAQIAPGHGTARAGMPART